MNRWRGALSRRSALVAPAMTLAVLLSSATPASETPPQEIPRAVRHVQVVAHPDDDILFMNPDLASGIHHGHSTVGIYLTGGESDLPDPARYAAQRQEGTRASYARMAGAPNEWDRKTMPVGSRAVELNELRAAPEIKLIFLNLPENNNPRSPHALIGLWERAATVHTLVTEHGTVRRSYPYRADDVIAVLSDLFAAFKPTTIRVQDAHPDPRFQRNWIGFHNHPDHVIAARLARTAADRYLADPRRTAILVDYRDYNVADSAVNLPVADRIRKKDYFTAYAAHDSQAGLAGAYQHWTDRTYYRWPRGGSWAARDREGRVHAFAVHGPDLVHWVRSPDGRWGKPRLSPTPGTLRPTLTLIPDRNGRLVLLAQSLDGARILMKRQAPDGTWPSRWGDLRGPGPQTGVPTVVVDGRGRLAVFARSGDSVSVLRERVRSWDPVWRNIGGRGIQGSVSAVLGSDGRLRAFAAGIHGVSMWREQIDGSPVLVDPRFGGVRPAGNPVAVRVGGRVEVVVRVAGGGEIARISDGHAEFVPNPGGVAAPVATGGAVLVVRDSAGIVRARRSGEPWMDLGGPVLDHPAMIPEPDGTTTLLAAGPNGRLLNGRLLNGKPSDQSFTGWHPTFTPPVPAR